MASNSVAENIVTRATLRGSFASNTPEWHALRATGIGGSEVGTICGLNKWESPFTLWAKKTGRIESSIPTSEAMEWGTRLEPTILDKFEDEHPELTVLRNVGTWSDPNYPWALANPDAIYVRDGKYGIIEVKTAQFEDDWSDGVPAYYRTQVLWYLSIFGYEHAYVTALFHGNRYREYEIIADEFEQEANFQRVADFRVFLESDIGPNFDGALSTYTTVRAMHPDIDTDGGVELGYLGEQFFTADKSYKEAEADLNEIKSRILDAMGTAKRGLVNDVWTFTRQARGTGTPYLVTKRG